MSENFRKIIDSKLRIITHCKNLIKPSKRRVKRAIGLLNTKIEAIKNRRSNSSVLNINSYLKNLYKDYNLSHLNIPMRNVNKRHGISSKINTNYLAKTLTDHNGCYSSLKDLKKDYKDEFNHNNFSLPTLGKAVKALGYSKRTLSTVNSKAFTEDSIDSQKAAAVYVTDLIDQGNSVFFVDESSLCSNFLPKRGWIPKTMKNFPLRGLKRIVNISLLFIIDLEGNNYWILTKNKVTSVIFWDFISEGIDYLVGTSSVKSNFERGDLYIVMDNAPVHRNDFYRDSNLDYRINIIYNPSYCCYMNLAEYFFSFLKGKIRKASITDGTDLEEKTDLILRGESTWPYYGFNMQLYYSYLDVLKVGELDN